MRIEIEILRVGKPDKTVAIMYADADSLSESLGHIPGGGSDWTVQLDSMGVFTAEAPTHDYQIIANEADPECPESNAGGWDDLGAILAKAEGGAA